MALDTSSPEAYLKSGGTLTNGQIPTMQQQDGKEPSAIPVDSLGHPQITPPTLPTQTPDTTNYTGITSGVNSAINPPADPNAPKTTSSTPAIDASTSLLTRIQTLMGMDTSKTAATQTAEDNAGVTKLNARQKELQGQITALNNENLAIPLKNENAAIGVTGMAGVNAANTRDLRVNAIKALSINSEFALNQGQLQNAKDTAQRAIDLVYKPIEDEIANKTALLKLYEPFMTVEQKAKADQVTAQNEQKKTELADSKKSQQDVVNAAQTAAANGDSTASKIAADALKLDPNSATFKEDLAKLQGKIQPNTLDTQYKQLQIQKLTQDINNAKTTSDLTGLVSPVSQLPDGTYDTATQDAILAKMSPQDASLVREVGNYQMDISKITSLRSYERQKLAAKVALVYPGFDMSKYATNAAYKKSLTSGPIYNGIVAANKSINHLTAFADAVSNLKNGDINFINKGINAVGNTFGKGTQEKLSTASTEASGLKDELAKFFKGTGATDVKSIDDWSKHLDPNATPGQLKGTVQGAITLLAGQLDVLEQQYKQTLGKDSGNAFLQPATIAKLSNLKNQGYKVDIPGVYYTDKASWEKYGGGSEADLTNAFNTLKAAGIPTTPENILQAAQL